MKIKLLLILLALSANAYAFDTTTGVDAQPRAGNCVRNNYCIVSTSHFASVINTSTTPRIVFVQYTICPQNEECKTDTFRIVVNKGTWHDTKQMSLQARYHYTGDFKLIAQTNILDANHNLLNTVRREGKIQVHN